MAGEPFNFWNDKKATDLDSFVEILADLSYEEFSMYVNSGKNDFASWIEGSLENKELADKIRLLLEKDLIKAVVVDYLDNQNNKLIIGPGKALQEDSLIKEIMQKNEDFFKEQERDRNPSSETDAGNHEGESVRESVQEKEKPTADFNLQREPIIENKSVAKTPAGLGTAKSGFDKDFWVGIIFGTIFGGLLTVIIQQIILNWG